ncbi:MAG: hypothetical protein K9N23_19825 [Akkermansiaceae bacterium]|nr:hypothetical protein [Akkermansiaceae bacterium]MCF7733947.1 hypothetical protein [Akkermansiaceae bacterium]
MSGIFDTVGTATGLERKPGTLAKLQRMRKALSATPMAPPSGLAGPATGILTGLHLTSNFLAVTETSHEQL